MHVDFKIVSLSEEIKTDVSIRIKGKEEVESGKLIILSHIDSITVKGLPQNIPDVIEIDAANLQSGDTISVGDIKLPDGIVSEIDPKLVVISVIEAKVQLEDNENENSAEKQEEA